MSKDIIILAIESSCDDTAASVIFNGKILSNRVASQSIHEQYGGVVPELASRAHQQNIVPIVREALEKAAVSLSDLNGIAFTSGPGLMGSLLVGVSFAKGLAMGLGIPMVEVDHMQAHILAHRIGQHADGTESVAAEFPFLCLTVSGGHTQLVWAEAWNRLTILGQTRDDAAGEAFDKVAKLIGLPYPGGPHIDRMAEKGNPRAFVLPKTKMPGLDFSFSGLKTAVLNLVTKSRAADPNFLEDQKANLCASVQAAVVDALIQRLREAIEQTGAVRIALAGGVSANRALRNAVNQLEKEMGVEAYLPRMEYCTDNAAMVAAAGMAALEAGVSASLRTVAKPGRQLR